ncbi:MAG: ice-binding family protein [Bacteroidota bacterium]|nr:ice-binding family protein [Bacteroidota bacterium]
MTTKQNKKTRKSNSNSGLLKASGLLLILLTFLLSQCKKEPVKVITTTKTPTVLHADPLNAASNIAVSKVINITFSEVMDASTINTTTFVLKRGATQVLGTITYSGNTATFVPASFLTANTLYTGTITTGSKNATGTALAANFIWSFTTGNTASAKPPMVISTYPAHGSTDIVLNTKIIANFNNSMNPSTINATTFRVKHGNISIAGIVSYSGTSATFIPYTNLPANETYIATVTTGVKDISGVPLPSLYTWSFTTGKALDVIAPTVTSTAPSSGAAGVEISKIISANFSKSMDPLTINSNTFLLKQGNNIIPGAISYAGGIAYYNPTANLTANTTYNATLTSGVKDVASNSLANNYNWSFTTGTVAGLATVNLRSAGDFTILAGAGVTNIGNTIINGDLGTSPTGTVNGFPPGKVNGDIHAANPTADQAKLDLTTAYNDAQGRSTGAVSLPGDLSGLTLYPGLYSNSTSVMLSAGNVTLDAKGNANAIFIFKMGSTLTTSSGTKVILSGGAQAKNIFWAVGSSATLGTTSIFYGNILADQSISLNTGATLTGRALTRIGAVTLQGNKVNKP